jgi:hypothetical protein
MISFDSGPGIEVLTAGALGSSGKKDFSLACVPTRPPPMAVAKDLTGW